MALEVIRQNAGPQEPPPRKGLVSVLIEVIREDILGEAAWMFVLAISVAALVGLIWLAASIFG
jgi:hypothetical protein